MRMMRSKVEVMVKVPRTGYQQEIWPGMDVDLDRVIATAVAARPAKGKPEDEDYQPAIETPMPAVTMADALGAYATNAAYFEPVPADPPAKTPAKVKE